MMYVQREQHPEYSAFGIREYSTLPTRTVRRTRRTEEAGEQGAPAPSTASQSRLTTSDATPARTPYLSQLPSYLPRPKNSSTMFPQKPPPPAVFRESRTTSRTKKSRVQRHTGLAVDRWFTAAAGHAPKLLPLSLWVHCHGRHAQNVLPLTLPVNKMQRFLLRARGVLKHHKIQLYIYIRALSLPRGISRSTFCRT